MSEVEAAHSLKRVFHCSFCGESQTEVKKLVAGPGVFICNECVGLCLRIIAEKPEETGAVNSLLPDNAPTEELLKTLARCSGTFESVDFAMQDIVNILREREVSWAAIGQALLPHQLRGRNLAVKSDSQ